MNDCVHTGPAYSGVIEGFYGKPWSANQRRLLFNWMKEWGLNTYFYSPKDDLNHRQFWRRCYDKPESDRIQSLITDAQERGIHFVYGIAPGLDIDFNDPSDFTLLKKRVDQMVEMGCRHLVLLFDDIPNPGPLENREAWQHAAENQATLANRLKLHLTSLTEEVELWFCPTVYCAAMASQPIESDPYLLELGQSLEIDIEIFWTGPDIVSKSITVEHLRCLENILQRRPFLWDNLHANDYDMRRLYLGPYAGREPEIKKHLAGVLTNPNCQFWANYCPIRTLAKWMSHGDPTWDPRESLLEALPHWLEVLSPGPDPQLTQDDLLWFTDAFYLPFEVGATASNLVSRLDAVFSVEKGEQISHLPGICADLQRWGDLYDRFIRIPNREALHDLYRYLWDIKEESLLLKHYGEWLVRFPGPAAPRFKSLFHKKGTYRGGLTHTLQNFLDFLPDETFVMRSRSSPSMPGD